MIWNQLYNESIKSRKWSIKWSRFLVLIGSINHRLGIEGVHEYLEDEIVENSKIKNDRRREKKWVKNRSYAKMEQKYIFIEKECDLNGNRRDYWWMRVRHHSMEKRDSKMRHRWEWVIDWLNECTNKFPWKVIDSMEFDVTCSKKREEKGKKTREKGRWGKMLKFPWKGYEWKGKRRGWTWIGGQVIWFPWNCLYWRMFDGIRLHMKVYGITWMNVLLPVKLSPWLRGKGDRVGHLPIKRPIPAGRVG